MSHHNSSSSSNSYFSGSNRGRGGGRRGYSRSSGGGGGSGRGEYFKNKYGRGVGSSWSGDLLNPTSTSPTTSNTSTGGPTTREETVVPSRHYTSAVPPTTAISQELLLQRLRQMDGRTYSAYRSLENCIIQNSDHAYTLYVGDKVQPDPFAPPTKFRMVIPSDIVQLPHELCLKDKVGRVATSDFLHRLLYQHLQNNCTSNNATLVLMATPISQYVLEQTATYVTSTGDIISQFVIPLPARGRTITSSAAIHIFDTILPSMAQTLLSYPKEQLIHHIYCVQDQHWLRLQLPSHNLVAFVANGSILPRASGADDSPKSKKHVIPPDISQKEEEEKQEDVAVPFQSPSSHRYTFHLPYTKQTITGMGVPRGITLIVGGGYHGKSTLLQALQVGIYNKVLGDGREYAVCLDETVKIRAEDKRAISSVDISTFIHSNHLPFPNRRNPNTTTTTNTSCFSTKEASGSTSQAAIIMEVRNI
jgi:predicted ABC-class ATPase